MGGVIKVIIREEDGAVHMQTRTTNPLPFLWRNTKFFEKESNHIKDYLSNYNASIEEKTAGFFPVDYGIVFIDFVRNNIVSCQGYSMPGFIGNHLVKRYLENDLEFFIECEGWTKEEVDDLVGWFTKKRIKSYNLLSKKEEQIIAFDSSDKKFLVDLIDKDQKDEICVAGFNLDMTPFTLYDFPTTSKGFEETKNKFLELGFTFNKKEEKKWNKYIQELKDINL